MIEADSLRKSFGPTLAVSDLSFRAEPGSVLGLLGPNGAGKSTLMRILAGYLLPDSGTARICGADIFDDPIGVRRRIGYLPETFPVYPEMRVAEYLRFVADMRGIPARHRARAIDSALESCGIAETRHSLLGTLSRGYRQRVGLAQAILHDPPVLILDEPTAGLDPIQTAGIRELIRALGATRTVLFSTHILGEADAICSGILVLSGGRLAGESRSGAAGLLRGQSRASGGSVLRLRLKPVHGDTGQTGGVSGTSGAGLRGLSAALAALPGIRGVISASEQGGVFAFELEVAQAARPDEEKVSPASRPAPDPAESVASWASAAGFLILGLGLTEPSLEAVFAELARGEEKK